MDGRPAIHYRDLMVWQNAVALVTKIYRLTSGLPESERYGLQGQIRRASVSIPSNIAEGHARRSTKEFLRFLSVAQGSLAELETQLIISKNLALLGLDDVQPLMEDLNVLGKMMRGLEKSLRSVNKPLVPNP